MVGLKPAFLLKRSSLEKTRDNLVSRDSKGVCLSFRGYKLSCWKKEIAVSIELSIVFEPVVVS